MEMFPVNPPTIHKFAGNLLIVSSFKRTMIPKLIIEEYMCVCSNTWRSNSTFSLQWNKLVINYLLPEFIHTLFSAIILKLSYSEGYLFDNCLNFDFGFWIFFGFFCCYYFIHTTPLKRLSFKAVPDQYQATFSDRFHQKFGVGLRLVRYFIHRIMSRHTTNRRWS